MKAALAAHALLLLTASPSEDPLAGKLRTDRTIRLKAIVNANPETVYRLWTTEDGVRSFFAPAARIDPRPGGDYAIFFLPDKDPEGLSHGTTGARVLKAVPGHELWFEWITFAGDADLGGNAPPVAPLRLRNARPLPTWVELRLDSVPGEPHKTHVFFAHYGFKRGPLWDESFAWFTRAWAGVLRRLESSAR